MKTSLLNYRFYLSKTYPKISKEIVKFMQNWNKLEDYTEFYKLLERDHKYIQWIFPTKTQSQYNLDSIPVTEEESIKIKKNSNIRKKFWNNYLMILRFFGIIIDVNDNNALKIIDLDQFKKCFFINFHNLLRASRILQSMIIFGYGEEAHSLCIFLKGKFQEMDKEKYYNNYLSYFEEDPEFINQCSKKDLKNNKLQQKSILAIK